MNDDNKTGKEICEAYARFKGVAEDKVAEWALAFWNAGFRGELDHVVFAQQEMEEYQNAKNGDNK